MFTKNLTPTAQSSMDFVLKIINVNGTKLRVQLWDMAGSSDPATVFNPLFLRNAVGCIVVGRADNQKSLENMVKWKESFDKYTRMPKSPCLPSGLFINHFADESSGIIQES